MLKVSIVKFCSFYPVNPSDLEIIKSVNRFDRNTVKAYLFATVFTGLGYCLTPIFINFVNCVISEEDFKYDLPMKATFPFDITKWPNYVTIYAIFCYVTYETILISVSISNFFPTFLKNLTFRLALILFSSAVVSTSAHILTF